MTREQLKERVIRSIEWREELTSLKEGEPEKEAGLELLMKLKLATSLIQTSLVHMPGTLEATMIIELNLGRLIGQGVGANGLTDEEYDAILDEVGEERSK